MKTKLVGLFLLASLLPLAWSASSSHAGHQAPALATPIAELALIGQIGGPTYAVAVQGQYLYAGVGPRLLIFDISRPERPILAGQSDVLRDVVHGVALSGDYVYLAADAGARPSLYADPGLCAGGKGAGGGRHPGALLVGRVDLVTTGPDE